MDHKNDHQLATLQVQLLYNLFQYQLNQFYSYLYHTNSLHYPNNIYIHSHKQKHISLKLQPKNDFSSFLVSSSQLVLQSFLSGDFFEAQASGRLEENDGDRERDRSIFASLLVRSQEQRNSSNTT